MRSQRPGSEIRAEVALARAGNKEAVRLTDSPQHAIGSVQRIRSEEFPNLVKIGGGARMENKTTRGAGP